MRCPMWMVLLLLPGLAAAESPVMDDFAYGMPLQLEGDGAVFALDLPEEVYRRTVRPELGDLRVFNAHNEVVPQLLKEGYPGPAHRPGKGETPAGDDSEAKRQAAPLYPLPRAPSAAGGQDLHIIIDRDGTLVDYYGNRTLQPTPAVSEYYLVDARGLDGAAHALYLGWDEEAEPFLTRVSVEASDDLSHWRRLGADTTIAGLTHQGHRLTRQSITLPDHAADFYRIHWPAGREGVALRSVSLALQTPAVTPPGSHSEVAGVQPPREPSAWEFDLGGHFPVRSVGLRMPQRNTLVTARLFSRPMQEADWQLRSEEVFYSLEVAGEQLQSEPVVLAPLHHRWWRLEVMPNGGGLGRGTPNLQVEWVPERLFFVARGEAPFTLAFGGQQVAAGAAPLDPLLERFAGDRHGRQLVGEASAGELVLLGGEERLLPEPPPLPWKKWLLWAVLLAGVLLLALMARALYRQLDRGQR